MPDQEAGNPEIPRVPREQAMQFLIGHDLPPVITVRPGESFLLETEDALAGRIRSADQLPIPAACAGARPTAARVESLRGPDPCCRGLQRGCPRSAHRKDSGGPSRSNVLRARCRTAQ